MQQAQARGEWLRGIKAIAEYVGVTGRTVERWIATGQPDLPVMRVGGRWVAHTEELLAWMQRRRWKV